jgi:Ca2+-binding EF-hand superfamily protein
MRLGMKNRVTQTEAKAAFAFVDLNKDGRIQKMEAFIVLKSLLTKNQ